MRACPVRRAAKFRERAVANEESDGGDSSSPTTPSLTYHRRFLIYPVPQAPSYRPPLPQSLPRIRQLCTFPSPAAPSSSILSLATPLDPPTSSKGPDKPLPKSQPCSAPRSSAKPAAAASLPSPPPSKLEVPPPSHPPPPLPPPARAPGALPRLRLSTPQRQGRSDVRVDRPSRSRWRRTQRLERARGN